MKLIAFILWIMLTVCGVALLGTAMFVHGNNPFSWVIGLMTAGLSVCWFKNEIRFYLRK